MGSILADILVKSFNIENLILKLFYTTPSPHNPVEMLFN